MKKDNSSYNQIIKSTSIFGGSQVVVILIGVIRTKVIALLLGPIGVGLLGIYQSIIDMIRTSSMLGMDTATVKEIAEANSQEDDSILGKAIVSFNKWILFSILLSTALCILFCIPISRWLFEDDSYAIYIALLSVATALFILTTGRSVILQGMRKIPELAKSTIWGSLLGLIITLPLYYIWRIDAIVPALILNALIGFAFVEFYYRRLKIKNIPTSNKEAFRRGLSSLKLGLYIVTAGFLGTLSMFLIRAFISRYIDLDAAGLFQSSWVITNVYLGLILKSMGADFFPRLSAISGNDSKARSLVNEQTYIILVIACPIIIGLLLFSDFALSVLYSSEFIYASTILKWQILGTYFKVLSWPIAFILLAKGKGKLFLISEVIFYAAYLLAAYLLYPSYGLDATGIGYFIAYCIYLPTVYFMVRKVSSFSWDSNIIRMGIVNLCAIICVFVISVYYKQFQTLGGGAILILSLIYAYINLKKVFTLEDLKKWFIKK